MTIEAQAAFLTKTQNAIKAAKTTAELKNISGALDGHEFMALPEGVQADLMHQYASREWTLKGAFTL